MYFLRGALPWQGLKINKNEDRYKKIYEKKLKTTAEDLCKGFPKEFVEYINYTRNMQYEQDPDYEYMRGLFLKVLKENNYDNDFVWDWAKKVASPKTHSTMVPGNDMNLNNDFKLNETVQEKKGNPQLINSTVINNLNVTNKNLNTHQVIKEENSQIKKKMTMNNNIENIHSTVFRVGNINSPAHNSVNEIEQSKKVIKDYEEAREKRRKNSSGGCCFA